MSQTFFVWPYGGKSVSIAGTFNNWNPHPLQKQGNYWFTALDLQDGVYFYKFVVDGRWVYDISQVHSDDGSGNWNNEIEVGNVAVHKESSVQPVRQQQQKPKEQKPKESQQKQPPTEAQQKQSPPESQQPKSKKQLKREKKQQDQAERQQKGKTPEPEPEPEPEPAQPESAPEPEPEPEPEPAQHESGPEPEQEVEQPEAEPEADPEPETQVEGGEDETPVVEEKKKIFFSILTLEIVGQEDANMEELEKFVRSIERPGLKWEGSAVKPHVFGMQKLEIICQARDDVAIEDDVLREISDKEDLVAGASISNFSC